MLITKSIKRIEFQQRKIRIFFNTILICNLLVSRAFNIGHRKFVVKEVPSQLNVVRER